ncbi:hypothetical protein [Sphingomonas corticis]|uniref:Cell wall polymerase n=1 Tax=Sphingomonas corticis TaxID=2722791 RepID=A0ABX1CRX4_9SPHN|nr:hypothetical protein [Sphingomonas corticis]NJR79060.1 hypothetical protein [Sphingomonas corticis]
MIAPRLIARAILRVVPAEHAAWAEAMACEIVAARDDRRFAMGCLCAAMGLRLRTTGGRAMEQVSERPRMTAVSCGVVAALLGLVYLGRTGAPATMLAANAGAIALGLAGVAVPRRVLLSDATALFTAFLLLATALLGAAADGAARWLHLGVAVQPSLVLLPAAILAHLTRRSALTAGAMVVAALALAWQPDRAMAGALLAALLAGGRRSGPVPILAAAAAFAITLLRVDDLPGVEWVDGVLFSAVARGVLPGLAVIGGTAVLLAPALFALRDARADTRAFGATWGAVVAAAALGNYPTPLVGYGGSAILGYLLAAACLPARPAARAIDPVPAMRDAARDDRLFRLA